jgi:hypothetical protein
MHACTVIGELKCNGGKKILPSVRVSLLGALEVGVWLRRRTFVGVYRVLLL